MKTITGIPVHSAGSVTWHKNPHGLGHLGTVEISELQAHSDAERFVSRVWEDACDEGFWLKSPRTGSLVLFTLTVTTRSVEGEIIAWKFVSGSGLFTVTVLND